MQFDIELIQHEYFCTCNFLNGRFEIRQVGGENVAKMCKMKLVQLLKFSWILTSVAYKKLLIKRTACKVMALKTELLLMGEGVVCYNIERKLIKFATF